MSISVDTRARPGRTQSLLGRGAAALVFAVVLALAGPAAAVFGQQASAGHRVVPAVNSQIAATAMMLVGRYRYRWGGRSPATGFDCSGLTSYLYQRHGLAIPRTAQGQFAAFRRVSRAAAIPGDLVFFHDADGYVYHVGVYEGHGDMVAAADQDDGIVFETIWSPAVTFGTLTH